MSYIAVGTAIGSVASAGISAYGSSRAAKDAKKAISRSNRGQKKLIDGLKGGSLFGFDSTDFTGKRPDFAEFERLDPGQALSGAAKANQGALGDVAGLTFDVNQVNQLSDATRFERLFPGGLQALRNQGKAAESLSAGELPFSDVLGISRDRAGLANSLGLGGTQMGGALPRDLGLSRLQAIQSGASLTAQGAQTINQFNPVSSQLHAQDNLLSGGQQVDLALKQNLLQQSSNQNKFNLAAAPNPLAQGILGFEQQRLQQYATGQIAAAEVQASASANAGAAAANAISGITGAFQAYGAQSGSGFNNNSNAGGASPYSNTSSIRSTAARPPGY